MPPKRIAALAPAFIILSACGCHERAMLFRADGARVNVTIRTNTGDGAEIILETGLPQGSRVTILDERLAGTLARVRIEEGDFKDLEAFVTRTSVRRE
jgi:hypothetical protein